MPPTNISFVIPMYNEEGTIAGTIEKLTEMAKEIADNYEIIIANDGSSDRSALIVDKKSEEDSHIKAVHLKKNTKFGGALKAGIKRAEKDIIVYTDSDIPVGLSDIKGAISLLENSDIVTAYSKIKKGESLYRIIMSKVYNFLIQFLFGTNIKDINSGLKIYKRKVFADMKLISNSPFIDVEIFIKAKRRNFVIKQFPLIFKHREEGKSYISRPPVVLRTIIDMLKFRFSV